ncbi:Adenylate and Guanylate cyclase catalytic domain containing protein [Tritrichomonas foetus]|uniref:Adenylate and Guanylate cyclase catalytic domain containing protein n=1 Tax=Tritrichomonas foetus TaxID=1144522 RepID=A0A1J4KXS1_9EUKA|nr:Adenylate and Guanylate cyclase catalytic domain containing protein [Tritrichomonas foetus]|eukprot:OHT14492.1 Adenylate and Guanylate cyclase catalytic domain containing protein [Tritrichomonas foetus]
MHAAAPKPVESSTLSKSQTSLAGQQQKKDLIEGKTSIIDLIFPMCDEMLKSTYIPKFLYYILFLFITIEIVSVSFWIQLPNFTDTESLAGSILKYFWMISFFSNLEINQSELTTRFVITTIITIIYFSILIIQGLIYHNQRRFIKWTLFLTRFFIEFIPIICLCPLGNFIGQNIYVMIRERATYSIIYFVFNLIYLCCFLFAHYLMSYLFAASTYISTAPTACWSGTFHFIYIVGVSLFPLFAYILQSFANWMNDVLIVIKIAFNFFIMWNTTFLPFVNYHTNTIIASLFTALVPLDIMALIHYNGVVIATHWKFLAFIVVFAGSFGIWRLLTNFIVRKVKKNLSRSALEGVEPSEEADPPAATSRDYLVLTDVVERQHYLNLQLHKSELKAELYLRIGISTQCSLFLDWSLMKFIAEYHNNNRMLSLITQYLSYFPCEIRLLNYFFFTVMSKPNLRVDQRFMIYQVHHVKGLRQSSASSEITDKLMEMKAKSLSGINDVRNFWLNVPMDPSFLYNIRKNTNHTCALFKESIDRWPNNCRLCEDYSTYLIECATNFTEGLKIKHRSELIEQGKNFVVDLSFRSLVRSYPQYLKGGFMDIKGNVLNRNMSGNMGSQRSQNSSGSQTSQMSTGTMDGELDLEIEEQLAKASFSFHRLRLAYQRSLQYRKSHTNQRLKYLSILATALSIAVVLFLYIYYYNIFQERSDNMEQQLMLNHFRYGFDSAVATVVTHWANRNNLISDELLGNETFGLAMKSPKTNDHNLQFSSYKHVYDPKYGLPEKDFNMVDEIQRWVEFSRDSLEEFISDIIDIASQGERVSQIFSTMVSRVVSIDFCDSNSTSVWAINNPVNETLKSAMTYGLLKLANLSHVKYSDAYDWHVNKGLCECIINIQSMYSAFDSLTITIAEDQALSRDQVRSNNFFMMAVLSVSFFVVIEVILNIALTLTIFELNKLLRTMADVDKQSRETASLPFKKSTNSEQETLNQTKAKRSISPPFLYFNVIFFGIFSVILFIVIIAIIEQKNQDFSSLNQWLFFGITRGNYMVETIVFTILDIFVSQQPGITQMIDHETSHSLATKLLGTLTTYNNFILRGYGDLPPCIGQNARLDHLHFADDCHGNLNLGGLHDLYRCASLDRGINLFAVWVQEMLDDPLNVTLKPDSTFYHVFHLMNDHLIDPCYEATTILSQLASNAIVEFHTLISIISFAGIAILLLVFILFFYNLSRLDVAFDGALQLLRRLPPLSVVSNLPLLNYLLNKKDEKVSGKMTVSKLIIHNSKNAVICLNRNETIDVVNKQVTSIFGYTPEQLLGQPISTIVPTEENSKVYEQIEFMRNGEAPLTFEGSFKGITDDETFLPIHLTLIGITDDNNSSSKVARSFVVIMDDETEFLRQQAEAEEAKKNSENLLYQILPRDIVTRLNHGETDISFSVPSASVIFVDIVKFSEYSATLTPAQIMENLSKVFACFDNCIAKYSLMTKIKLIGDVYMAAANLFTPDEPVQNHASQTVQFGLDVLAGLEEVNTQLDSSLQVRIGINTDGPLIAGVLGTDKPVFDIIGDPINVAARLQSNGIPGTVQISQTTYEAINGMNFNIEERGLVMLKGKGKKMAYIVRPTDQSSFFIGSVHELPTYNTSSNPPTAPNPT